MTAEQQAILRRRTHPGNVAEALPKEMLERAMCIEPLRKRYYCIKCEKDTLHQVLGTTGDRILLSRCGSCGYSGQQVKSRKEIEAALKGLEMRTKIQAFIDQLRSSSKNTVRLRKKLYKELMESGSDFQRAPAQYSLQILLRVAQLVDHQKFGRGVVMEVRDGEHKAIILFKDGERLLRCGGALPE